jgi:hypothetical protein
MTIRLNRQVATESTEQRRPSFPLEQQSSSLFLGWGPKL